MIRVENTHLPVAALTHPGMKGKNNEDRFGVSAFRMKSQPAAPVLLAVLSDGIGGNRAGEVASELAVNTISQVVADSDGRNPQQILDTAIHRASEQIFLQAQENPEQHGMGATCACVWVIGDRLFTATVGDSRIYLMRGEAIQQLSTDHTWIQEALERGLLQPDQVSGHPNAHVIRRYLGSPNPPEVDFRLHLNGIADPSENPAGQGLKLLPDDILLLCTDGLTDLVANDEILAAFLQGTLEEAGQKLVDLANQRGGHDNITLIAVQIPEPSAAPAPVAEPTTWRSRSRKLLVGCLAIVILAILAGGIAGGWLLYSGNSQPTATASPTTTVTPTSLNLTRTPGPTRTASATWTLVPFASSTPTLPPVPGLAPTLTPWPTNTPALPVVTLSR